MVTILVHAGWSKGTAIIVTMLFIFIGFAAGYLSIDVHGAPYVVTDVRCPYYAYSLYDCDIEVNPVSSCSAGNFSYLVCFESKLY